MSSKIPEVDIDPSGVFKYILIKLDVQEDSDKITADVVRGYAECGYHADINDKFNDDLKRLKKEGQIQNFKTKVQGGGRIQHDPDVKMIKVYGYSQGYGKADHELTVEILKKKYPGYDISWSDEGY
ncbi:14 kDa phosphohistidine phosphatase-like isoform X2 [Atheta coriaria]